MCSVIISFFIILYFGVYFTLSVTFDTTSDDFNDFSIVVPKIYEKTVRTRRDTFHGYGEETVKSVQVGDWTFELFNENNLIVEPTLLTEWISDNGDVTLKAIPQCDYKLGIVNNFKTSSRVALSLCDNFVFGYINIRKMEFLLQPLRGTEQNGQHLLYRKNRFKRQTQNMYLNKYLPEQWLFNLTGDVIDIEEKLQLNKKQNVKGNDEPVTDFIEIKGNRSFPSTSWRREQIENEDVGYFYDSAWTVGSPITRKSGGSSLPPRWLEIAVAVDHTLIAFHGKDKVEQYVLALLNIVNAIYQDPSLEANLHLVLTRMLLYENPKQSVVRPGNAKKSLENVNSWNHRLHVSLAPGEVHHDVAIWLTRSDFGGPSGYAPVAGACDSKRSCALNKDEGLTSAFIIAHELAHILGLSHDGDKKNSNHCDDEATKGSVMAPLVAATFHRFSWSQCSRNEFRKIIKKWSCLSNAPKASSKNFLNTTVQTLFTMDEQCRMEFGDGYSLCRAFDIIEPCSHLWCGHEKSPLVCKTKKGSPLEGTECGFNRWCRNGYCEKVDAKKLQNFPIILNPQDGGWSSWSSWGQCSRTCGTGVQFKTRQCNNPKPSHGGNTCEGVSEKWRICKNNPCPEPYGDMRAQQCKNLPRLLDVVETKVGNMTWLPYESSELEKKCKLICISESTNELFETDDNLIDGTPCSYENSDDICIQGVCQFVGCDGQLFSTVKTDMCGVCGGNNSDCSNVESTFHKKLKREVSRVAVFPRMATRIKLEANVTMHNKDDPSVAFILKNRRKKKYQITIPNTVIHTNIIEGTKFYYQTNKNKHKIWANGPVLAEMVILMYAPISEIELGLNVSLHTEYIIKKDIQLSNRYEWILGGWGPCSASCGGGRRQKTVACLDSHNQKLVRRKHCSLLTKPNLSNEKCNTFDCYFQWVAGKWEPCSATCGLTGIQYRELYCVPQVVLNKMLFQNNGTILENPWKHMVNPHKCSGITPIASRSCNRVPCPSYWTYGQWSQCSTSCGKGLSYRLSYCPPPEGESFFTCGEEPLQTQKRECRNNTKWGHPACKGTRKKACLYDKSDFCSLSELSKYCNIREFRNFCCKTCSDLLLTPVTT